MVVRSEVKIWAIRAFCVGHIGNYDAAADAEHFLSILHAMFRWIPRGPFVALSGHAEPPELSYIGPLVQMAKDGFTDEGKLTADWRIAFLRDYD